MMIPLETKILKLSGLAESEFEAVFTEFEMDGKLFKMRTIYIGDRTPGKKPTLLLTHGNLGFAAGFCRMLKILSERFRVVAFDNMNLGGFGVGRERERERERGSHDDEGTRNKSSSAQLNSQRSLSHPCRPEHSITSVAPPHWSARKPRVCRGLGLGAP